MLTFAGTSKASASGDDGYAYGASGYYFQYDFASSTAATIGITYNLSDQDLNCCGSRIQVEDLTTGQYALDHGLFDSDLHGMVGTDLASGETYRLTITLGEYLFSNAATVRGAGSQSLSHDDEFDFAISSAGGSAVPEPASWAMLIGGVGVAGGAMRRGRRARGGALARA